ncbi:hypothetical protein TL16_g12094 [Triparma laevis f. inornata]|uniref:Uncharacterized protein n=1 Tax=Triparma laevis f. inornata TaxID=1714386 RepID=A0A9W7BJH2_9STRA|nr:hypothetical protein TL16_g12094 [Triparma laevis f. inornata]
MASEARSRQRGTPSTKSSSDSHVTSSSVPSLRSSFDKDDGSDPADASSPNSFSSSSAMLKMLVVVLSTFCIASYLTSSSSSTMIPSNIAVALPTSAIIDASSPALSIGTVARVNEEMKKMENVDAELTKALEISLNGNKKLRGEVEALKRIRVEGASGGEAVKADLGGNVQLVEQPKIETELPVPTAITPPPPPPTTTTTTSSISFQMIPSPSTSIPKYTGYTFWSSDFHISPIADLKDIFQHFQMEIIDQSLSGHCKIMKPITCEKGLKVRNRWEDDRLSE